MSRQSELERFSAEVSEHLFGFYLPFWCGPALDREKGGWMGWLANDLKPDRTQPKGLIVNCPHPVDVSPPCIARGQNPLYRDGRPRV